MSHNFSPQVGEAVKTVYGNNGYERFTGIAAQSPDISEGELLDVYRAKPYNPVTLDPFGHGAQLVGLTESVNFQPDAFPLDEPLRVVQLGARADTTWPLASALKAGYVPDYWYSRRTRKDFPGFTISAYSTNSTDLENLREPVYDRRLHHGRTFSTSPTERLYFDEPNPDHIVPTDELATHVKADVHDILDGPLPEDEIEVDIVAMFDQLWPFPPETRTLALKRVKEVLRARDYNGQDWQRYGVLLTEGWTGRNHSKAEDYYIDWLRGLGKFGLYPSSNSNGHHILIHNRDSEPLPSTSRVEDALGVLVTAQQQER